MIQLYQGDCLELLKSIPDGSVDLVLTDPPFGTMKGQGKSPAARSLCLDNCDWDVKLPTVEMFEELSRVLRPNGKCVLFGQEPYTSELINEEIPSMPFAYRAIWLKNTTGNPLKCNKAMLCRYEDILIFAKIHPKHDFEGVHPLRNYSKMVFDFIGMTKKALIDVLGQRVDHFFRFNSTQFSLCTESTYTEIVNLFHIDSMEGFKPFEELQEIDTKYREDLIKNMNEQCPSVFNLWQGNKSKSNVLEYAKDMDGFHPTQKPVKLLEDLIQTFSNTNDIVLDFTMGSGSTGVACVNTGRRFIGMEIDGGYFEIAKKRIEEAEKAVAV